VSETIEIRVPDIGDFKDVPVVEVLVKPGATVKKNDSLIVLETEKASLEIPSSADGVVESIAVKPGDKVTKGSVIVTLRGAAEAAPATDHAEPVEAPPPTGQKVVDLVVPDIGDFKGVPVIEVLVKAGDEIKKDASLIVLETEKASMEIPASSAGKIVEVRIKAGDRVSKGDVIATLAAAASDSKPQAAQGAPAVAAAPVASAPQSAAPPQAVADAPKSNGITHASPSVRRFTRELGVELGSLRGSGPNGRITREDVRQFVKSALQTGASGQGGATFAGLPAWPKIDFAQFGEIERAPLSRIKKLSGPILHRNWVQIPHITNYDEADITDLEAFRNDVNAEQVKSGGAKLTMLAFLVKACVAALKAFPDFNASLDGDALILKHYYNIGFAADTPNGLVVPVLKDADKKGLLEIGAQTAELGKKARDGKLAMADMQGGSFTISSIGSIGGTQFTQIVNAPEVAILGATRAAMKPVWDGKQFVPRLIQPVSVSYDHRVIDGAAAARFLVYLTAALKDFRRISL
jgi:pyruvate dehydrogenase E2 component (dihydrolipoamide acetyltransferase)